MANVVEHLFICFLATCICLLGGGKFCLAKKSLDGYSDPLSIFNWVVCLFIVGLEFFMYSEYINSLSDNDL